MSNATTTIGARGLVERLRAIATGEATHSYLGECPAFDTSPVSRDLECPACRVLAEADAYLSTNPRETGSKSVDGIEQMARELLAAEYRTRGMGRTSRQILSGGDDISGDDRIAIRAITAALRSAEQPSAPETVAWNAGAPPKPWRDEWFIAETAYGDRVVLKALPEGYTYDFKTADESYIRAEKIKRWMQFPDSEFVAPPAPRSDDAPREAAQKPVAWLHTVTIGDGETDSALSFAPDSVPFSESLGFRSIEHVALYTHPAPQQREGAPLQPVTAADITRACETYYRSTDYVGEPPSPEAMGEVLEYFRSRLAGEGA